MRIISEDSEPEFYTDGLMMLSDDKSEMDQSFGVQCDLLELEDQNGIIAKIVKNFVQELFSDTKETFTSKEKILVK